MSKSIMIRAEQDGDQAGIFDVVADAFPTDDEARLVDLIRDRQEVIVSLVATHEEDIVGHVLVSPIQLDHSTLNLGGLAPLSVLSDQQQRGIGGQLMESAIASSRSRGLDALFLLGDPTYYRRFGFVTSHINNEYGATDAFMHLELTADALACVSGTARYVSAFSESSV